MNEPTDVEPHDHYGDVVQRLAHKPAFVIYCGHRGCDHHVEVSYLDITRMPAPLTDAALLAFASAQLNKPPLVVA